MAQILQQSSCLHLRLNASACYLPYDRYRTLHHHHHYHQHQGLDPLIRSVSRVTCTAALANVSSVFQLFSFLVVCSDMISKRFGFVAFFASVKASSVCIRLSCLVCIQSVVHGVWSRLFCGRKGPLAYWDRGFESHRGHGYLSIVSVVCCQVEVSATSWSLVQRSPTDCAASLCVI